MVLLYHTFIELSILIAARMKIFIGRSTTFDQTNKLLDKKYFLDIIYIIIYIYIYIILIINIII